MINLPACSILILAAFLGGGLGFPGRSQPVPSVQWIQDLRSDSPVYVSGELLVKFKKSSTQTRIQEINEKFGTKTIRYLESIGVHQLKITDETGVEEMVRRYSELPEVEYAEPNFTVRALPKKP